MRVIVLLVLVTVILGLLLRLVGDVVKAVSRAMSSGAEPGARASAEPRSTGRLVRDPVSGNYIDEESAVKAVIDGQPYFFESSKTRDAFLEKQKS